MKYIIGILKTIFNSDQLYIGGCNAHKLDFKLNENIKLVINEGGIKGGAKTKNPQKRNDR